MADRLDLGEGGFEALLEAAPDGILVVDEAGTILLANRRAEHLFGYPAGGLVRIAVDSLVPDRFRAGHSRRREGYQADPHPRPMGVELELFGRRSDGVEFPVEISLSSLRTKSGLRVITIVRDVTERRALEAEAEALRQRSLQAVSDAALRDLDPRALLPALLEPVREALDASWVAISIREPDGDILRVRATLGLPDDVLGSEVTLGEGIAGTIAAGGAAVHQGVADRVDPRWREHVTDSAIGSPLSLRGEVLGVVVAGRDRPVFTDDDAALLGRLADRIALAVGQGQLYEAAQAAQSRLREILGDVVGIVWESDDADRHRYGFVSDGAESLLGYPTESWTEQEDFWIGIVDPADRDDVVARAAAAVAARREHELEYRVRTADGRTMWLRDHVRVGEGEQGTARLRGLMVDVTERRDLETTLLHAQKMQAVGQLAGGVAHDFNNMLTAIIGYSGLLATRLQDRDALEDLGEIERAAKRAQGLTEQLLSFSRRQGPRSELLDLGELVAGMEPMLRRLIDEDIDLVLRLGGRSILVEADPGRLEQVLVNLVINARDAMGGGGTLTVSVETRDVDGAPWAGLHVTDTGTGMDEETRQRVFEPFFTTKAAGKGTGLGLSTVYGIVDQAAGRIVIESELGAGTEITVLLPIAAAPAPAVDVRLPTVLIVEDEASLRKLVRRVLEADGKRVLEASDGREALTVLEHEGADIDLLITDIVMPGMNGPELVEHVTERWPDLRVVYSSGYTDSRLAGRGFDERAFDLLRKPYTVEALRQRVTHELDASSSNR
jgi:PAS domain S-box-containing protein